MASAGDNFKNIIAAANQWAAMNDDTADSNLAPAVVEGPAAVMMAVVVATILKAAVVE